jgi:adenine C2-methylase RlmN of 23S rRNA A2503 and tRNA A37
MSKQIKSIPSIFDKSINYIFKTAKGGSFEARYVRRAKEYISAYPSSHDGCKMGCEFCWLTQNKQTSFNHLTLSDYELQLQIILKNVPEKDHELLNKHQVRINVNFMAKGEVSHSVP